MSFYQYILDRLLFIDNIKNSKQQWFDLRGAKKNSNLNSCSQVGEVAD